MTPSPSPLPRPASPPQGDVELLERLGAARADLLAQVGRRIVGQKDVLDGILTAIFSGGHALLLGVQEHQVPAAGQTHPLPAPFFVLATQNPIEQEGTYPLPEAQLDRFMFELRVSYPSKDEEAAIVEATTGDLAATVAPVLTAEDVLALQHLVRRIPAAKTLVGAAVTLVRMTRPGDVEAPAVIKEFISWGAGPRASQYLVLGAKARAALDGRPMPDYDDLRAVAPTVLTHRLVINFAAEAAGRAAPDIVDELLKDGRWLAP